MSTKSDFYDILGLPRTASASEIKAAYRKLALTWHPDRHQGADKTEAERKFKEINEAYQVLSDPQKKSTYDQFGHTPPGGGNPFAGAGGGQGPFQYYYSSGGQPFSAQGGPVSGWDFGDPFEIFEQFFSSQGGSAFGGGGRFKRKPRYSVAIGFEDAVKGAELEVSIDGKKKKIKIPAGVDEGSRIDFADFTLSLNVRPSNKFEREGSDIYNNLEVPYSMAVLGGEIGVKTIDGEVKIRVRPGTRPGSMIRLRERGVPHLKSRGRGDHYVRVLISVPSHLSREQKKLFEELQETGLWLHQPRRLVR